MRCLKICAFLVVTGCLLPSQQESKSAGTIEGFVTSDPAALAGVTIRLDRLSQSFHRKTQTNASGYYSLDELQPGAYSLCAEVRGLGCIIYPNVALMPGQRLRQDFVFARAKRIPRGCEPLDKPRTSK